MALHLGCDALKTYYRSLPSVVNEQWFFLHIHRVGSVEFNYKEKFVNDPYKLLWKAETKDKQMIVVKFTYRYNKAAHDLCNKIGKAPSLFHVSEKKCGLYLIVMEFVDGQKLCDCDGLAQSDYKEIINDIEEAVIHIHNHNIVFADLCDSNILVIRGTERYHRKLIDFDWAGGENVEHYPSFINPDISWPTGVGDERRNMTFIGWVC